LLLGHLGPPGTQFGAYSAYPFSGFGSNSRFDYSLSRHFNFSRYCYFNAHSQLGLRRE
jgi:hypothetical protein